MLRNILEVYLQVVSQEMKWIALAEWWYNTNHHLVIKRSPFEAIYGYSPPKLGYGPHLIVESARVDTWMKEHRVITQQVKKLLKEAQDRMSHYANKNMSDRSFVEGD